jgi:hypothetical protein
MTLQSDVSGNPGYFLKLAHIVNGTAQEVGQYTWSGD